MNITHRTYLSLAIPFVLSTMTTPLLGAVDTAVVGQLSNSLYLAAVAVGAMIFNTILWLFGFLRVSTSGFTAQAAGSGSKEAEVRALVQPILFAVIIATAILLLNPVIENVSLQLLNPGAEVAAYVSEYYGIRIWGVPFSLLNYVILGWLMGRARIRQSIFLQVMMNSVNIVLDLVFVHLVHLGVSGVAMATIIAEGLALVVGLVFIFREMNAGVLIQAARHSIDGAGMLKMIVVNRDLFIRTICLLTMFNVFTAKGAEFGTDVLAANAILIQVHYIMAYFFDGFANASSVFAGRAAGSKSLQQYDDTAKLSSIWAVTTSIFLSGFFILFHREIIQLFTNVPNVIEHAETYAIWIMVYPLTSFAGLVFYGLFTGTTKIAPVRNSIIQALLLFLIIFYFAVPAFGNHGLWLSFTFFSLGRSLFLGRYMPALRSKLFASEIGFENGKRDHPYKTRL